MKTNMHDVRSVHMPSVGRGGSWFEPSQLFICVVGLRICAGDSRFASLLFHRWLRGKNLEPLNASRFEGIKIYGTPTP